MKKIIVFDLDDTLYYEVQFVESAFNYINGFLNNRFNINIKYQIESLIEAKEFNLYDWIVSNTEINSKDFPLTLYLNLYRYHFPSIQLTNDNEQLLKRLKALEYKLGIITDGRSITQRNKIKALGLEKYIDIIIISEETGYSKPDKHNFQLIENYYPNSSNFTYIGDNTSKDFEYTHISDKWNSICLQDIGLNIHQQNLISLREKNIISVKNLKEIIEII